MEPQVKLSVVIPTKNGEKTIRQCLETVFSQSIIDQMEVIVIDSGSTDNTLAIVRQYPVRLYQIEPEDFNHGQTRNMGNRLARGEFVLFTVQDARFSSSYLVEKAIKHFSNSDVMAVGCKQVVPHEPDKNPLQWYRPVNPPRVVYLSFSPGKFSELTPLEKIRIVRLDNVCAIYRKKALEQLPFPSTDFGEDMLWASKALDKGWTIILDHHILVYHYHHYDNIQKLKQRKEAQRKLYTKFGVKETDITKSYLKRFFKIFYLVFLKRKFVPQRKLYWFWYNIKILFFYFYNYFCNQNFIVRVKKLKIWFTDFWHGFNPEDNYFFNTLKQRFLVELDSERPDFLFFSLYGENYIKYNTIRILFIGENYRPNYNFCDFSISFDYDIYNGRNLRLPLYVLYGEKEKLIKHLPAQEIAKKKTKFCSFLVSNPNAKERIRFFKMLSEYKKVDSEGKVLNNIGYRVKERSEMLENYKFSISFENSIYPGYTTEKLIQPIKFGTIPIYWGNPLVHLEFNPNSFINVMNFKSFNHAVEYIKKVDQDEGLYFRYLEEPFFYGNKVNEYYDEKRFLNFIEMIYSIKDSYIPVAQTWKQKIYPIFKLRRRFAYYFLIKICGTYEINCIADTTVGFRAYDSI